MGHRFYNPDAGRWLKRDPIKERGGKNLYAFVQNEPVSHIDLFGLQGSRCRKKCGNRTYNPTTHCCCKGKVLSKKPVNTGMRICTGWSVTGLPLWHTWIEIDGNWSADFDDNGVKAPAGPAYLAMPEGEKDCTPIKLSPCRYNIKYVKIRFKIQAMADAADPTFRDNYQFPFYVCGDWVRDVLDQAKDDAKGCAEYP